MNRLYEDRLVATGLIISGRTVDGQARIVELADHPFYLATLFLPQLSSTRESPHPLITAFLEAAVRER